ncbi:transcriptional regulator LytR [Andreesenia angusta]|uniref:Transcriptional regulator LytR n=1 Tax=Andreesenia angusta TaxID=39480 RepID=A0A1S1V7B3_9FIRM|nr:LCP family protein [Andreesenia angusta]OHW62516.1 transcriptional regulator LytR [Andreesenia angusta]
MKRFLRVFFSWLVIFSVVIGGGVYLISEKLMPKVGSVELNDIEEPKDELTFLVMGVDAPDKESAEKQRTDTIMLCRYVPDTGKIAVLSIPRDTRTLIPGHGRDKLNHAHAYGGPELTVRAVNNLLDMNIKHYVRVDYNLVNEVVDSLGGVEVDVPMDMYYNDPYADPPLEIDIEEGLQTLDGDKAMQFLRFRKGYSNQDLGRIEAQQDFIKSAIDKAMSPKNIIKLPSMIKAGTDNIDTNIPLTTMLSYVMDMKNINTENIQMATLPGEPDMIDEVSYFLIDEDASSTLMDRLFYNREVVSIEDLQDGENEENQEEIY